MTKKYKNWKVYLVKCADNSLYCGIAKDVVGRIEKHNSGKGAKYTRSKLPVTLVVASSGMSKSEALKLEHVVKKQPAGDKIKAIKEKA